MSCASEALLDGVGRFIGAGAWELDVASNKPFWSAETCIIHGVPPDFQPTFETAIAFFAPEARAAISDAIAQAVTDGRPWDLELPLIRADGRQIWVRAVGVAVTDGGRSVRLSGVLQDVTAHIAERQALRDANERLMLATQAGGIGIWDWDIVNNQMVWDTRMYELYGRCPSLGAETVEIWRSSLHPDDRARAEQALQDSLCGHMPFATHFRIIWSDGSVHHIRGAGSVTCDAAGRPLRMLGSNWDITAETLITTERMERESEKKAADAELEQVANQVRQAAYLASSVQREKERFRAAIDAVQGVLWTNDASGRMEGEQPGWAALTGQDRHEYQGYGWALAVHPDDAQPTIDAWNQAVAERQTFVFEHRVRRLDGCWRTFAIRAVPLLDPQDGCVREWVGVHTDITERREAEAALRQANNELDRAANEFRTLADGMADLCWMAEPDGHIYWYNRRWYDYTGKSAAEMEGWGWQSVHDPQTLACVLKSWRASIATGTDFEMTFPLRGADGVFRPFLTRVAPIVGSDGKVTRWLGTNVDVSELDNINKTLEERVEARTAELHGVTKYLAKALDDAKRATQAKSRFLAGMSHELRTPLNGILGNARLLRLEGGLQPAQAARVDSMLNAGNHLLEMIHCVLDLSEIETERVTLQAEPVDVRALMTACLDMVRHMAVEKGLAVNLSVAADVPERVIIDPVRLRQILVNLLGNAAKFTARGGFDLRLRTTADGARLRFDVADTGPGIPEAQHHSLFQDFARLQSGDDRAAEGAGLGLALSSRLAALMGGQLGHLDNPGGGAIFWLELPLLACEATVSPGIGTVVVPQTTIAAPDPARQLHVLVVDDSEMNLDIAASFIRIIGHQVSCANGGAEAVEAVAAGSFDLVFMDVQMPGMDGLEATRRIRALPGTRAQVPVIALTAQVFTEQLDQCRQAGMSGHLAKPFSEATLYATLAEHVPGAPRDRRACAVAAMDLADANVPAIDLDIFRTNTRLLKPASVVSYLEGIVVSAGAILSSLRAWDGKSEISADLLQAAHKLAGNVGLFGFARAADAARRFEGAARLGTPETRLLADSLAAALQLSIREADERVEAARKKGRQDAQ